jgi:hypothetical protein
MMRASGARERLALTPTLSRASGARERLALTPTLSRKREREKDSIDGALASWRYFVLLLGRGR